MACSRWPTSDAASRLGRAVHLHTVGVFAPRCRLGGCGPACAGGRHARGLTVSVDAASAVPLRVGRWSRIRFLGTAGDVLFANADEAGVLLGDSDSERLLATDLAPPSQPGLDGESCRRTVIVSWAPMGRSPRPAAAGRRSAGVDVDAVDATGAGDAFAAAFRRLAAGQRVGPGPGIRGGARRPGRHDRRMAGPDLRQVTPPGAARSVRDRDR